MSQSGHVHQPSQQNFQIDSLPFIGWTWRCIFLARIIDRDFLHKRPMPWRVHTKFAQHTSSGKNVIPSSCWSARVPSSQWSTVENQARERWVELLARRLRRNCRSRNLLRVASDAASSWSTADWWYSCAIFLIVRTRCCLISNAFLVII